jgi:hypothetical protein
MISRVLGITGLAAALLFAAGCHHSAAGQNAGPDPADANLAPVSGQTQVLGENASYTPQQQGESYPEGQQAPAPIVQGTPNAEPNAAQSYPGGYGPDDAAEQAGEEAIEETDQAPPPLPEYDQPPAPGPDYIWTPGYWAWGPDGYYWVPGAWVEAPYYGALWTPPWWGWYGGRYRFHRGYWGPHVGYYGGIDYGYGYIGIGYFGGYWRGNNFYYNRSVTHVGGGIHNYYDRPVVYNNRHYGARPSNRVSYNGGRGGINRAPLPAELAAGRERHVAALPAQRTLRTDASRNRNQSFKQNHGRPASAAETRGVANAHGIAPTPRGVQPGRSGMPAPNAAGRTAEHGAPGARPGEAPRVNNGQPARANPGERNAAPAQRGVQPAQRNNERGNRPAPQAQPQRRAEPQRQVQPQRQAEPQRREQQPRVQSRPAPQQRMAAPRVQSRPAPQRAAPRAAPRPAPRAAPQPRGGGEHPQGHDNERH